jgi:protein CWC15
MTTAHRPTFESAKGKNSQNSGTILHTRSLPAHTKLKYRQRGQGGLAGLLDQDATENSGSLTESSEEKRAHLRAQLLQREENYNEKRLTDKRRLPSPGQDGDNEKNGQEAGQLAQKRARLEDLVDTIDTDDDSSSSEDEAKDGSSGNHPNRTAGAAASDSNSESGSESESDDEDELQRELEKIRQERAEQKAREEARERERELEAREREIAFGNPLLNKPNATSSSSRRKWNDDVVFKNQAKGVDDKKDNGFINDMIRSDFHRKFMNKYIK